jgi:hypothetical protein
MGLVNQGKIKSGFPYLSRVKKGRKSVELCPHWEGGREGSHQKEQEI